MLISEMHLNIAGFHLPFAYAPVESNSVCHSHIYLGLSGPLSEVQSEGWKAGFYLAT